MPPQTALTQKGIDGINSAVADVDNNDPFSESLRVLEGKASARQQRPITAPDVCETVLPGNQQTSQDNPSLVVSISPNSFDAGANQSSNPLQVTVPATYITIIQANPKRQRIIIQNVGTTNLFLILGNAGSFGAVNSLNYHVKIAAGQSYIDELWVGRVDIVSDLAGGVVSAVENWRSQNANS